MIIRNKCGYELLEYISCNEEEIINYENVTGAGIVFKVNSNYLIGFNNWRKQWEYLQAELKKEKVLDKLQ